MKPLTDAEVVLALVAFSKGNLTIGETMTLIEGWSASRTCAAIKECLRENWFGVDFAEELSKEKVH
jgi:hypothetical protein